MKLSHDHDGCPVIGIQLQLFVIGESSFNMARGDEDIEMQSLKF